MSLPVGYTKSSHFGNFWWGQTGSDDEFVSVAKT